MHIKVSLIREKGHYIWINCQFVKKMFQLLSMYTVNHSTQNTESKTELKVSINSSIAMLESLALYLWYCKVQPDRMSTEK